MRKIKINTWSSPVVRKMKIIVLIFVGGGGDFQWQKLFNIQSLLHHRTLANIYLEQPPQCASTSIEGFPIPCAQQQGPPWFGRSRHGKQTKQKNKTKQNKQPSFLTKKTKEHQDNILAIELWYHLRTKCQSIMAREEVQVRLHHFLHLYEHYHFHVNCFSFCLWILESGSLKS